MSQMRFNNKNERFICEYLSKFLVRVIGFEPIWDRSRGILSPLRLPISPQRHMKFFRHPYKMRKRGGALISKHLHMDICRCLDIYVSPKGSLEAPPGFEPGSQGFADPCLTTWLWRRKNKCGILFGAGNEIRTRDIHLGKVTLYP